MQKYNYKNKELNDEIDCYLDEDNNISFRGKDIATILDYKNSRKAIKDHVSEDDKILIDMKMAVNSRGNETLPLEKTYKCFFINESGFYSLILSSKKPEAKEFKHWVTSKVLPSIRKYGPYKLFNNKDNMLLIESENDLHYKIVSFIRKKYDNALMIAGPGENQISNNMRIKSYKKGYDWTM